MARVGIYNSRNYYRLLNDSLRHYLRCIYNSRNYYRLLNQKLWAHSLRSTTVEITIGYLTCFLNISFSSSTTVEITIGYLTLQIKTAQSLSTTVEITIGYLTIKSRYDIGIIYNSRNYYRLLNYAEFVQWILIYNSRNYYRLLNW